MGRDRQRAAERPGKWQMTGPRIWLPCEVLTSAAFISCGFSARSLLLELSSQLRAKHGGITNNGDLTTAHTVLGPKGWADPKTIRKASAELESVGLIVKTRQGMKPNLANLWALTWLPLNESPKLDISAAGYPFHAYRKHPPVGI